MNGTRRRLQAGLLAGTLTALLTPLMTACSVTSLAPPAGFERLASPQPVSASQPIEVIEFFWYGCPHCADMHPRLLAWSQRLPPDVALRMEPVALGESWVAGSRLHFTLQALGELPQRSAAVFEAVQLDGLDLGDEAAVRAWAVSQGMDRQRFDATWRSAEVQARAAQSLQWGKSYPLTGVPTFIVDGKYLTSNRLAGSSPETLAMVDELVRKARAERQTPR